MERFYGTKLIGKLWWLDVFSLFEESIRRKIASLHKSDQPRGNEMYKSVKFSHLFLFPPVLRGKPRLQYKLIEERKEKVTTQENFTPPLKGSFSLAHGETLKGEKVTSMFYNIAFGLHLLCLRQRKLNTARGWSKCKELSSMQSLSGQR